MTGDIDIDVPPSFDLGIFPNWIKASMVRDGSLVPHPCGIYAQKIPVDPITNLSAIPYEEAEQLGFFKIDFLHLNVYKHFSSRAEIEELVNKEPDWNLLLLQSTHQKLFQLANHGDLLCSIKPKCIEDLADVLALIRPGKKQILGLYCKDRTNARKILWANDTSGYSFKKSHAIGYAYVVILQLHLIEMGKL